MNRELEKFIKVYLNMEQAPDVSGDLRPTLHAFRKEYVDAVNTGLATVLRTRELSVGDYERLTDVEFDNEESLYTYLQKMYEYLFGDGEQQPAPPM
ncbi:hypothetical protein [Streptomyces sp. Je 1-332]|uniref:hypothetical protein n=1 Tax=Streptomyces sp. Je 1-332 TaxID=3231270 RepID=UPI003458CB0F